jgi:hypothetical protein
VKPAIPTVSRKMYQARKVIIHLCRMCLLEAEKCTKRAKCFYIYVISTTCKQINGPSAQSASTFMSYLPSGSRKMDQAREVILHLCQSNIWKQKNGPSAQSDSTFMSYVPTVSRYMYQARKVILHLCHTSMYCSYWKQKMDQARKVILHLCHMYDLVEGQKWRKRAYV